MHFFGLMDSGTHINRKFLLIALCVGLLYWFGAQISLTLSNKGIFTPVWPAAAVAAAAAVLFGVRSLALVLLFTATDFFGIHLARFLAPDWAVVEAAGILLAALLTIRIARQRHFAAEVGTLYDLATLFLLAGAYAVVNGLTISVGYCFFAQLPHCQAMGVVAFLGESFTGDFFGAILCMPALLGWMRYWPAFQSGNRDVISQDTQFALTPAHWYFIAVASASAALAWVATRQAQLPVDVVGYLVMPLLVWAALQFRSLFVYTAIMLIGLVAISLQLSTGNMILIDPARQLASLLLFLLSVSSMTMVVHVVALQQQERAGEQATQTEKERIGLMLKSATDAVVSFDVQGFVTYLNPAASRLFGSDVVALGKSMDGFLPALRVQHPLADRNPMTDAAATQVRAASTVELILEDGVGQQRALEVAITHYQTQGHWESTAFIHDVTHRQRAENEIRTALARQEELNHLRSEFVSMTSHELRTPLATILSSTELLTYYSESLRANEKGQILSSIVDAVTRMTHMVDRVLFIGKVEANLLEFKPQKMDLVPLCKVLVQEVLQEWPNSSIGVTCTFPDQVVGWFDEKLVRHALGNLLSNAVKYSRGSQKPVHFAVTREGTDVRFVVTDHGIGIPQEDLPHLFTSFHRASNVGNIPGTGLGLSIVKRSVEAHRGRISLESTPGSGTIFSIILDSTSDS